MVICAGAQQQRIIVVCGGAMEKRRCSSQKLKQSGSCAVHKGPDGRGVVSESSDSAAGKKRKKKNKAPEKETAGEAPPLSFICRQESASRQTKKHYPGKNS